MKKTILWFTPASLLVGLTVLSLPSALRADGAKAYGANCTMCHAADGSGSSPAGKALGAKDLGSAEVQGKSDQQLSDVISNGEGKMPAFGKKLQPDDIKQLVAYVRTLKKK